MKQLSIAVLCAILMIAGNYAFAEVTSANGDVFAMDTYMRITCYGDNAQKAVDESIAEIKRLDDLLSVGNEDSEIYHVNHTGSGILSEDSAVMLDTALSVYDSTDGSFDITIYPMMELWGFTTQDFKVPSEDEILTVLLHVGASDLKWNRDTREIDLGNALGIDLGGIAKGYTSDRLVEIFEANDLDSAVISLGGNVHCFRTKPDGSLWKIGIQSPYNVTDLLGVLKTADRAVITSGGYERYFTDPETGITYHHIIDPKTGYSSESGLISVSIVAKSGVLADALSTACFILGLDKAADLWRTGTYDFDMILMTDEDKVYITEGLDGYFTTDYQLNVIHHD